MHRFNEAANKSTLRVCESNDGAPSKTGQGDNMEIAYYGLNAAQWSQDIALFASGEVCTKLAKVTTSGYPETVLKTGFKPAAQVEKEGMDIGEQNKMLVEKVEELNLHLIRMQKEIDALKKYW